MVLFVEPRIMPQNGVEPAPPPYDEAVETNQGIHDTPSQKT